MCWLNRARSRWASTLFSALPLILWSWIIGLHFLIIVQSEHLSKLKAIFQTSLRSTRLSISPWNSTQSLADLMVRKHLASSANSANVLQWDTARGISLMNNTNRAGPSRESCGTPEVTGNHSECLPSIRHTLHPVIQIACEPLQKRAFNSNFI